MSAPSTGSHTRTGDPLIRCKALIIGGGATGAGIARDLALRGMEPLLLEMSDFATGATGRSHGMLHGGGRYVVKDPESARECASESRILKRIASYCIENTGGIFVGLDERDVAFADLFRWGCGETGVACEEIPPEEAVRREPGLSRGVRVSFLVEDAAVDPFFLTTGNIESARSSGAEVINHSSVTEIQVSGEVIDKVRYAGLKGEGEVKPEIVINASGAWAGEVAAMANIRIPMSLDKGSLVVINGRMVNGLVNRLRRPSDGDIIVPSHSTSIVGTTSVPVGTAHSPLATRDEVDLLMGQAAEMVPGVAGSRAIRAYAGVRPLPACGEGGRETSRTFKLIDHTEDGIDNFVSVIGGKLTTYRLMAEKVSDMVMDKLGARGRCRTMLEEIQPRVQVPKPQGLLDMPYQLIRERHGDPSGVISCLGEIRGMEMVCSCEQVMRGELVHFSRKADVWDLGDLMRRTRAGMGYCQSGACVFGMLSCLIEHTDRSPEEALEGYMTARWRGISPVLHLGQMRQEVLKLYLEVGVHSLRSPGGEVHETADR